MAELLGPQTILSKALPTGTDGVYVAQWALRSGRPFMQVVQDLALALGDFNQEMLNKWGWLFSITEEPMLEYEDGGTATEMPMITDVDKVDARHVTTISHMVDLKVFADAIGGSKRWFRDAREAQIGVNVSGLVKRAEKRFERWLLQRWFTNTENLILTSGYDVPFVRGGGNVAFVPPSVDGQEFTSAHDHYLGVASGTYTYADMLNQMAETLQEHGHEPPYTALVSRADTSAYFALADFVEAVDPMIIVVDRGGATSGNQFFRPGTREFSVIGHFQSEYGLIELRTTSRLPTAYAGLVKSYGTNDGRNPLAVRVHPDVGFGVYLVLETADDRQYPIKQINVEFEFGIGCGRDRTNGVAAYRSVGGTWANPTIS